jgi:rhomboid protease GluP
MIEERLEQSFTKLGYQRINSNAAGIYLFYHIEGMELTIVSVIHAITGNELMKEQYEHILEQIKDKYRKSYPHRIRLLSLILTASVDRVKHFCIENREDEHWIIDIDAKRLIIYENQSNVFSDIREQLEALLFEEARRSQVNQEPVHNRVYPGAMGHDLKTERQDNVQPRYKLFTLMNTIIIVINVLAFLLLHYVPIFGGEGRMLTRGALSWHFVLTEKEYYRVLTSMFMHSDFSHLFNNMLVLIFVGDNLERAAGKFRYLFLYFGTGILAGITSIGYNMWKENGQFLVGNSVFSIGASGAIFGVVGAMLFIVAINRGRLEDISTRQMVLFVVFSLYGGIVNTQIDQAAHIGGFLAGILLAAIVYRRPKRRNGEQPA